MGPLGDSDRRGSGDESLAFVFVRGSSTGLCAGDWSTGVMSAHVLWKVRRPPSDHRETAGMCQKEHRLCEPDMKGPSKLTGRAWATSPLLLLSIPTGSARCRGTARRRWPFTWWKQSLAQRICEPGTPAEWGWTGLSRGPRSVGPVWRSMSSLGPGNGAAPSARGPRQEQA